MVYMELRKNEDAAYEWLRDREDLFVRPSGDDVQRAIAYLVNTYPNFGTSTTKNQADPYAVALAMVNACAVVCHEKPSGNLNGPKILDICRAGRIPYLAFVDMLREQGVRF